MVHEIDQTKSEWNKYVFSCLSYIKKIQTNTKQMPHMNFSAVSLFPSDYGTRKAKSSSLYC